MNTEETVRKILREIADNTSGATLSVGNVGLTNTSDVRVNPATEDTLTDVLTELELKANLTDVQPVITRDEIPTNNNAKIELGYNANDELIQIKKTIGAVVYKRPVTDDDYTGGVTEGDITRTKTFDTWVTA